jgi:hypothetical protein
LLGHVGGVFGVLFQTPFLSPIRFDDSAHMVSIRLVRRSILHARKLPDEPDNSAMGTMKMAMRFAPNTSGLRPSVKDAPA